MKMTKRLLAALMVAVMLILALPVLGVSAAEASTVLTLDETTLKRTSDNAGTLVDGRLEFYKNASIKSNITLKSPLELTPGDKVARIYLRAPKPTSGEFVFFEFSAKSGKQAAETVEIKGNDLAPYQYKSMVYEVEITVAEAETVALTIKYNGNFDLVVDRIEVMEKGAPLAANVVDKEGTAEGSKDIYTFTAEDLAGLTMVDSIAIARENAKVLVPASYLNAWFEAGYTQATMTFDLADPILQKRLTDKMKSFNASNYAVAAFDFAVTLTDAEGNTVEATEFPGEVTVETEVYKRITSKLKAGARKLAVAYQNSANSTREKGAKGSLASVDGKLVVSTPMTDLGTFLITVSCMK